MNKFPLFLKVYICLFFLLPISARIFNLPWIVLMLPILIFYFLKFIKDRSTYPKIIVQNSLYISLHIFAICTFVPLILKGSSLSGRTVLATGFFLLMIYLPTIWLSFLSLKEKQSIFNALFITITILSISLVLETFLSTYLFTPLITDYKTSMPEIYRMGFLRAQGPLGSLGMAGILTTFLPLTFQLKSKYVSQIRIILISGIIATGSYAAYLITLISLPICFLIKYSIKLNRISYSAILVFIIFIIFVFGFNLSEISESHFNLREGRLIARAVGHHGAWNYFFNNLFEFNGLFSTSGTYLFKEIFSNYIFIKRGYLVDAPFLPLLGIETSLFGFLSVVSLHFTSIFSFLKTQKIFAALSVFNSFIFGLTTDHRIVFYTLIFVIFILIGSEKDTKYKVNN